MGITNFDISIYTDVVRWIFVFLAMYILISNLKSLLTTRVTPEVWAYLNIDEKYSIPITHWENVIGRSSSVDLRIKNKTVSKNHGILMRNSNGTWNYEDLDSTNGTLINYKAVNYRETVTCEIGDKIQIGGVSCTLFPISLEEKKNNESLREKDKSPISPWRILLAISLFQMLTVVQLVISLGDGYTSMISLSMLGLMVLMWTYVLGFRMMGSRGFELELIAFFLSTISLAIVASSSPDLIFKQFIAIFIGLVVLIIMCLYLRSLKRSKITRWLLVLGSVGILIINLIFGTLKYGAVNWLELGGVSFQPSELVKVAFVWIGAATLDELYKKRNLNLYMIFSGFCLICLAIMGDFGTASIYFVAYLIISFLRSGDFSKFTLTFGGAVLLAVMVVRFKPYIANRFSAWRHVWEYSDSLGYQQTRTMSATANGGLAGLGAGNGMLKNVAAADTDLVFGMVAEEWGMIIAILLVICIITFLLFSTMSIVAGRSTFYTIVACGATSILVFQTMLNVFGALDLLPLTGVTFPFVSNGGTSMVTSWAMLAFIKATDMRKNSSLAIKNKLVNVGYSQEEDYNA
ncbi:MAG TPA: FtsW/RodA/SpoVE family cell cycle protein [Anaerovoracaceae bacterium]|nr:FtsW/RodA/SpoVE family cell cycle protein [Anaerovoracaceae bacterium]